MPLVCDLLKENARMVKKSKVGVQSSIGIQDSLVRRIVALNLESEDYFEVRLPPLVVAAFLFQVRSVTIAVVQPEGLSWTEGGLTIPFCSRNGQYVFPNRLPLRFNYPNYSEWQVKEGPLSWLRRWPTLARLSDVLDFTLNKIVLFS